MPELKQLSATELKELYEKVVTMRKAVLELVQNYEYDANSLVSKTFEQSIERWYGYRILSGKTGERPESVKIE